MAQIYFDRRSQSIKDKFLSFDFLLVFLILALGIISIFAMYSSEQGKFGYYTQNHLYRFLVFFWLWAIAIASCILNVFEVNVLYQFLILFFVFLIPSLFL